MNREDYSNSLVRQAYDFEKFSKLVYEKVDPQIEKLLPMKQIWDVQKIFITGCGDSWLAGVAAKECFDCVTKIETNVPKAIEFSRILNNKNLGYSPNTPLVIIISFSGSASRVIECAKRATSYGANTIAITNNPESGLAKNCNYCIDLSLPQGEEYFPGETTYNACLIALYLLALRIGRVRNTITPLYYEDARKEILNYVEACQKQVPEFDRRCFDIAQDWKDLKAEDFIGDYSDYATAFFSSAKVIESFGGYTTYDDSEDWCHINFFLAHPETIGRVVVANKSSASYNRLLETIKAVEILKSKAMIISDTDKQEFPENMEVFTTVTPKYFWLNPLGQHLPFDMVAGYIGALKDVKEFRADEEKFNNEYCNERLRSKTKIVII